MFRPMRRHRQQLPDEMCADILRTEKRGVLALAGDDGYPYAVPMNFVLDGDMICFHCAPEGHRIDAIKRCEKASFCVIDKGEKPLDDWAYYVNSVIVFGRLRFLEGDEKTRALRMLGLKYYPTADEVEEEMRRDASRCVCLGMQIDHISGKRVHER